MFGTTILEERESKYNGHVKVIKTFGIGTYIQCNGLTQSGGIVESIWRSTLRQIRNPTTKGVIQSEILNILILGLGGGTVAKLLRKKYPNAKITGVEIDPIMIEFGKKYLDLDKYNIDIKIADARKFEINNYDLVIVDTYLGDSYIETTGSEPVRTNIAIFNRLYYGNKKEVALKFGEKLKKLFKKVEIFYPTANVMFFCYNS